MLGEGFPCASQYDVKCVISENRAGIIVHVHISPFLMTFELLIHLLHQQFTTCTDQAVTPGFFLYHSGARWQQWGKGCRKW